MDTAPGWRRGAPRVDGYYLARLRDRTVVAPCLVVVEGGEAFHAAVGLAAQHVDGEAFVAELLAEAALLVQAGEDEAVFACQLPGQPGRQHLGAADVKRVQELADGFHRRPRS